jgi:hypothetical protein
MNDGIINSIKGCILLVISPESNQTNPNQTKDGQFGPIDVVNNLSYT